HAVKPFRVGGCAMTQISTDHRLLLQSRVSTPDGAGGFTHAWADVGMLWAAFAPQRLGAGQSAGQATTAPTYRLTMRFAPVGAARRPVAGQRLVEGMRRFDIIAVGDSAAGQGWLNMLVEEEMVR